MVYGPSWPYLAAVREDDGIVVLAELFDIDVGANVRATEETDAVGALLRHDGRKVVHDGLHLRVVRCNAEPHQTYTHSRSAESKGGHFAAVRSTHDLPPVDGYYAPYGTGMRSYRSTVTSASSFSRYLAV